MFDTTTWKKTRVEKRISKNKNYFLTASCRSEQLFFSVLRVRSKTTPIAPRVILLKIFITSVNITQGRDLWNVMRLFIIIMFKTNLYTWVNIKHLVLQATRNRCRTERRGRSKSVENDLAHHSMPEIGHTQKKNAISDDIVRAAVQVFLPTTTTTIIIMILGIRQSPFIRT